MAIFPDRFLWTDGVPREDPIRLHRQPASDVRGSTSLELLVTLLSIPCGLPSRPVISPSREDRRLGMLGAAHTAAPVETVQCPALSTLLGHDLDTLKPMRLPSTLSTEH